MLTGRQCVLFGVRGHVVQGYAPVSIRLVEAALKGGWGPVAEVLSMLPGGQFDSLQVGVWQC